ncbi:hypothetical protein NE237_025402 [Protea cynaroides]|uniref:Uncharacterized protein n=1 Tax=Protea cynaroides TaxID=273540 RepID=A0A9Q0K037_9MAGN|nr:hypothetical protein NE237_025402 [Protea cynaroides]
MKPHCKGHDGSSSSRQYFFTHLRTGRGKQKLTALGFFRLALYLSFSSCSVAVEEYLGIDLNWLSRFLAVLGVSKRGSEAFEKGLCGRGRGEILPDEIRHCHKLVELDLYNNALNGCIPSQLGELINAEALRSIQIIV